MRRFLVTSDWHLDWVTRGLARFEDLARVAVQTAERAIQEQVADYYFLGDLCDPDRNLSVMLCIELVLRLALMLQAHGIESHWLVGNHDVIEDGSGTSTLTPLRAIEGGHVHLYDRPKLTDAVLALPFTPLSHAYDPVEWARQVVTRTEPLVVLSHLSVDGIVAGEETKEMPRGRSVLLPLEMLKARAAPTLILQGHYHERRVTPEGLAGKDVIIPGSLGSLTFGEERNRGGFLIVEW